jgi:hypothetical protein
MVEDEITRRLHNNLKWSFLCWDPLSGDDELKFRILVRMQR